MGIVRISPGKFPPAIGWSLLARQSGVTACAVRTSQPRFKSNIHGSPSIVRIRVRYCSSTASCFEMPPLCETTPHLTFLGAQAIGGLDLLQGLAPVPLRGLKFFDSQFDSVAWRC